MCCPCFNDFTSYIKSFFIKNEDEIKIQMLHLAQELLPIILPIIKQEVENIINQRLPNQLQIPIDNLINKVL